MKLVSDNSEAALRQRHAEGMLKTALIEAAANLLRVVRGAGRPEELMRQFAEVVDAAHEYREATGAWPDPGLLSDALRPDQPTYLQELSDRERARYHAEQDIVRGALQMIASDLLGQRTQHTAGHHEMYTGLNQLQEIGEAERREFFRSPGSKARAPRKAKPSKRKRPTSD